MAEEIELKYIGNGDFLVGIPARDLTEQDLEELKEVIKALGGEKALISSGLYEKTTKKGKEK